MQKPKTVSLGQAVVIDLSAVIVMVSADEPSVLLINSKHKKEKPRLPFGPFDPEKDRTMEEGLRRWVKEQTSLNLGYVEQLYTFGDRFRDPSAREGGPREISVGYVALIREPSLVQSGHSEWFDWYRLFPWEDCRNGKSVFFQTILDARIEKWVSQSDSTGVHSDRQERADIAFGLGGLGWDPERVLERYELLYEAGLVEEAYIDGHFSTTPLGGSEAFSHTGLALHHDHRRILATALGRLRGKIRYRPVIFEVMPPSFTLFQLQKVVEGLAGSQLHKQNFRRLVASEGLVEPTNTFSAETGGRPARLFYFRRDVVRERMAPGVRVPRFRKKK